MSSIDVSLSDFLGLFSGLWLDPCCRDLVSFLFSFCASSTATAKKKTVPPYRCRLMPWSSAWRFGGYFAFLCSCGFWGSCSSILLLLLFLFSGKGFFPVFCFTTKAWALEANCCVPSLFIGLWSVLFFYIHVTIPGGVCLPCNCNCLRYFVLAGLKHQELN